MKKITAPELKEMKKRGDKITALTAYDATFARLLDLAGIDVILVGDSLGMVIQGESTTLQVTLDDVIYHTRAVSRGIQRAHLVADMPFMSYQISPEQALDSAGRLIKEGRAEAVKLEGGIERAETIRKIVSAGIPVMGHIGLTPQSVHKFGGYRVQGKTEEQAKYLKESAKAIEEAGAYSLVLESIPWPLAKEITEMLSIPTIGIGAGKYTDGQILVIYDLLGMDKDFNPKFLKKYADLFTVITEAVGNYIKEVREGIFPDEEHSFRGQ